MNTVEILKAARELISDEKRWTQNAYCRVNGRKIEFLSFEKMPAKADCFCSIGSLAKAGDISINQAEDSKAYKILCDLADEDLFEFNDTHTHAEVLALFDSAIAWAEARP